MNKKPLLFSRICLAILAIIQIACTASSVTPRPSEKYGPANIEAIKVHSSGDRVTVVDIVNSRSTQYSAFILVDPPRIILDIQGIPGSELPQTISVNDKNVKDIEMDKGKSQVMTTRVVVGLAGVVDYKVEEKGNIISLKLMPKTGAAETAQREELKISEDLPKTGDSKEAKQDPDKTMIINKIIGFDFAVLEGGKSRLTVTAEKKPRYGLKRKDAKTIVLAVEEVTVTPVLQSRIDSSHFGGAVDRVKSSFSSVNKRLSLFISLKEMVPFHVDNTDSEIYVDFDPTSVKPTEKKVTPSKVVEPKKPSLKNGAVDQTATIYEKTGIPLFEGKKYTGTPMTMDFVKADVTNILRLIGEVSNLNIIWGPEVKGTVSMRLKNVPWDQALDLVLANNDLIMRREENVIWITTRERFAKIEEESGAQRKRKLAEQKEAKELEPLVIEYFPLDFAKAEDCKNHITLSERGSISVDSRTNTIIVKDIASNIEESRKIVARFDTPVKQIMIEARIVDAKTEFSRELGVQWASLEKDPVTGLPMRPGIVGQRRNTRSVPWEGKPLWDIYKITDPEPGDNWPSARGEERYGGSFSTNGPEGWAANIGLNLASLTSNALGAFALDASLALAEGEGKVKIISAPKVIASNGEKAVISRGDIIYKEIATAEGLDVKELPATLSLTVTPTVSFNNYVSMKVQVTDDKVKTDLSGKTEKSIETNLMIRSGETVVIGGIFKEDSSSGESGIPWLKDIPILGWLFKAQIKTIEKTELLIFLMPTVIKTSKKI